MQAWRICEESLHATIGVFKGVQSKEATCAAGPLCKQQAGCRPAYVLADSAGMGTAYKMPSRPSLQIFSVVRHAHTWDLRTGTAAFRHGLRHHSGHCQEKLIPWRALPICISVEKYTILVVRQGQTCHTSAERVFRVMHVQSICRIVHMLMSHRWLVAAQTWLLASSQV